MPAWPWAMPSQMAMVLNSMGSPPASRIPFLTSDASWRSGSWPGHISFQLFAIAISGLSGFSRESTATPVEARWALVIALWNGSSLSMARITAAPFVVAPQGRCRTAGAARDDRVDGPRKEAASSL